MASNVKLTERHWRDLGSYDGRKVIAFHSPGSGVGFRKKAWLRRMRTLEHAGLVEPSPYGDFYITPAGLEALREVEGR